MRKRRGLIAVALVLGVAAGWFYWEPERRAPKLNPEMARENHVPPSEPSQDETAWLALRDKLTGELAEKARRSSSANDSTPAPSGAADPLRERVARLSDTPGEAAFLAAAGITPDDEAAYEEWARARGFEREATGYEYYDRETLESLAETGDMYAQQRLGFQAASEEDFLRAEVLLKQAATGGSAYALDLLAFNATSRAIKANVDGQPEQAKRSLLEAFAWSEMANRRGYEHMPVAGMREGNIQKNITAMEFELTKEDMEWIENRADEQYRAMEQRREDRGLGAFDNSVPSMLDKLRRAQEAFRETHSEPPE